MGLPEMRGTYMRIYLCCYEVGMPQKGLNRAKIESPLKEFGGKAVPERMQTGVAA